MDNTKYYVVKKKAVPEVLIKVVETKRLLATRRGMTIQEATEEIGISRSSFYKYKDDIFPFHENEKGRTVTMVIQLDDTPGVMAELLNAVARYQANILTIHQSIPINGVATLTLSVEVLQTTKNLSEMVEEIEQHSGVVRSLSPVLLPPVRCKAPVSSSIRPFFLYPAILHREENRQFASLLLQKDLHLPARMA